MAYQNVNAIFEFLQQFASGCLSKKFDYFEIVHKNVLNFGLGCISPLRSCKDCDNGMSFQSVTSVLWFHHNCAFICFFAGGVLLQEMLRPSPEEIDQHQLEEQMRLQRLAGPAAVNRSHPAFSTDSAEREGPRSTFKKIME